MTSMVVFRFALAAAALSASKAECLSSMDAVAAKAMGGMAYDGVVAQQELEGSPPIVPGTEYVGVSFNLLDDSRLTHMVDLTTNLGMTTPDGSYQLVDGMVYGQSRSCALAAESYAVTTSTEYQEEKVRSIGMSGTYKAVTLSASRSTREVFERIDRDSSSVSESTMKCKTHELTWLSALSSGPSQVWTILAGDLPVSYNASTACAFHEFIDRVGTHVRTKCTIGGIASQKAYTSEKYWRQMTLSETRRQAGISAMISAQASYENTERNTEDFLENTSISSLETEGGRFPLNNNFDQWAQSVENLDNVECIEFDAVPISEVFRWYPEALADSEKKAESLDAALAVYFDRPGCTASGRLGFDPDALQDDGSCGLPNHTSDPIMRFLAVLGNIYPRRANQDEWARIRNQANSISPQTHLQTAVDRMFSVFSTIRPSRDNKTEWDRIRGVVSTWWGTVSTDPALAFERVVFQMQNTRPSSQNTEEWARIRSGAQASRNDLPWFPTYP